MAVICERFDNLGQHGAPARLGIMGGTFDPIHIGHLACAEQAREAYGLDAVVFIPAGNPVFKRNRDVTSAGDRLEMCRLATRSNPAFDVSAIEIERGGDTYTVDTLRQLRAHYPNNVELCFITGADAVHSIVKWRESAAIADLARLIAVTRPGYVLTDECKRLIAEHGNFSVDYLEVTALAISSSDLRARVAAGKSIRYLTMQRVYEYIRDRGLYAASVFAQNESEVFSCQATTGDMAVDTLSDEFFHAREKDLAKRVGKKRFHHVQGVVSMAENLAQTYGVDSRRARLAALLHDWDKKFDDEEIRARVREVGLIVEPWVLDYPRVLHGMTAAAALGREYPTIPAGVLQAIARHTVGATNMSELDMVVYIADALEPGRTMDCVDELRALVGTVSLEQLFIKTLGYWTTLLLERGKTIYPDTLRVWNTYASKYEQPYLRPKKA